MKNVLKCTAILLGCFVLFPAQAGALGRLFFTPQQRAQLEHERTMKTTPPSSPAATAPSVLAVNGIVQRKGGARTVWINGVPQSAGSSDERTPDSLPVSVPGQSQPIKLKVGQKLLLNQSTRKAPSATGK